MTTKRPWGDGTTFTSRREFEIVTKEFIVDLNGERLDLFLAGQGLELSRSQVQRLVDEGCILLNGSIPKASRKLRPGDRVSLTVPPPKPVDLEPEPIPLNVVYQDEELLVVDKQAGLTVHPSPGHPSHTLVNALLALCPDLKGIGGELRPGIVHRLDKDTSGLMMVAKSARAHLSLTQQLKDRSVRKGYLALAVGKVSPQEGTIDAPIGRDPRDRKRMAVVQDGRDSCTGYRVIQYLGGHSFLDVFPRTGRTHQIRVHFAYVGHPLVGDAIYGRKSNISPDSCGSRNDGAGVHRKAGIDRHFLHAYILGLRHPTTDEYLEFQSPLPQELLRVMEALSG
jgi:23S rRNA pseudouridine1911/1915/1917 synthase